MSSFGEVKIKNATGDTVNPATEDKLQEILAASLSSLRVKKVCSEADVFTPLIANGEGVSDWIDSSSYSGGIISIVSDQDSAEDGLILETSKDGINVFHPHKHTIKANTPDGHHYPTTLECDYFRIRYINGPTAQTEFRIHFTMFVNLPEEGHVHSLEYPVDSDHSASIARAVLLAKNPSGEYHNIECTSGLNLKVSIEEAEPEVTEQIGMYPVGAGSNGSVTMTNADTAYNVPVSAPSGSYKITVQNNSDVEVFIGYENSSSNGMKLFPGDSVSDNLGAGQQLFAYCGSAGKTIQYTMKMVN